MIYGFKHKLDAFRFIEYKNFHPVMDEVAHHSLSVHFFPPPFSIGIRKRMFGMECDHG